MFNNTNNTIQQLNLILSEAALGWLDLGYMFYLFIIDAVIFVLPEFFLFFSIIFFIVTISRKQALVSIAVLSRKLPIMVSLFLWILAFIVINSIDIVLAYQWILGYNFDSGVVFNPYYTISVITQGFKLLITLLILFILSFTNFIKTVDKVKISIFFILVLLLLQLSFIMISSINFVVLLLALEGFSLILYIMITLDKTHGGVVAAVKYFTFGTLGSIFLFWGVVHLYLLIPTLAFVNFRFISSYVSNTELFFNVEAFEFATTALIIGFLIKLGAAPTHQWVSDVYAGAPFFVTIIFATFTKIMLFVIFVQISFFAITTFIIDFSIILSLFIGCYFTLRQTEIKRFIAYSSIVHVAFLLMGDVHASFIYIFVYTLSNMLLFSVLISVRINRKEIIYLSDLKLLRQKRYSIIFFVSVAFLSSAGLPPFIGFYGKFMVWTSLLEDLYLFNNIWTFYVLILSILISLITIFYYIRAISYLFVGSDNDLSKVSNYRVVNINKDGLFISQLVLIFVLFFWTLFHEQVDMIVHWLDSSLLGSTLT